MTEQVQIDIRQALIELAEVNEGTREPVTSLAELNALDTGGEQKVGDQSSSPIRADARVQQRI